MLPWREKQVKFSCSIINLEDTLADECECIAKSLAPCSPSSEGTVTRGRSITMFEERRSTGHRTELDGKQASLLPLLENLLLFTNSNSVISKQVNLLER